jgi:uncharacterized protein
MLIEFKVKNFRSFREEQTLSLVAGAAPKDRSRPESLIACEGFKVVKTAAIYGANASGKSNLVRAISFMRWLVVSSATKMNLGERIADAVPFRLDEASPGQPASFEVCVMTDEALYVYGFAATSDEVVSEWLRVKKPGGRLENWLLRERSLGGKEWDLQGPLRKETLLRDKTRANGLALSRGAELNIPDLADLFLWFQRCLLSYDLSYPPVGLIERTASRIRKEPGFAERVLHILRDSDLGIQSLVVGEEDVVEKVKNEGKDLRGLARVLEGLSAQSTQSFHPVVTLHRRVDSDKLAAFRLVEDESMGTQRLFALTGPVLDALDDGHTLVLDEFECSMHPLLARKIVELFQSETANKSGAQLIFATHDTSLMTPKLLRRDQVWFAEKNEAGATQLFSLYDFADRPRADSAFARNYIAGRYGAVPNFGRSLEDGEITVK